MSIAVSEALFESSNPNIACFGDKFLECYKRDRRGGYSDRIQKLFESSGVGVDIITAKGAANSDFNGAAMRAVPIGCLPDPEQVKHVAAKQALLTHDTLGGVLSAQLVALMSHYALYYDMPFQYMHSFLVKCLGTVAVDICLPWDGRVAVGKDKPGMGMLTARAVHTLLCEEPSLMSIMKRLICWGGDTDSVAAIAWGIASARYQDEVFPEFMERDLELAGNYGPVFLRSLGTRLMQKYNVQGARQ